MTINKEDQKKLLDELESLSSGMDVPDYKRRNPLWLHKNASIRNGSHKSIGRLIEICDMLISNGVTKG